MGISDKFPELKRSIDDFLEDEEGSITRKKALMLGSMILVFGLAMAQDVYATHRTHYTHRTHSTHRTSNHHGSHTSHVSYSDSSNYGSTTTRSGRDWPDLSSVQTIKTPELPTKESVAGITSLQLEQVNSLNHQTPADTTGTDVDSSIMQLPPDTPNPNKN